MSGDALNSNQSCPFEETAIEDWVLAVYPGLPARTLEQLLQLQFHWGKPPPAAEPKTLMINFHSPK